MTTSYNVPTYSVYTDARWSDVEHKKSDLGWSETGGSARTWWNEFESENVERPELILTLLTKLKERRSSIQQFFIAYVYSDTNNMEGTLAFLDFARERADTDTPTPEQFEAARLVFLS